MCTALASHTQMHPAVKQTMQGLVFPHRRRTRCGAPGAVQPCFKVPARANSRGRLNKQLTVYDIFFFIALGFTKEVRCLFCKSPRQWCTISSYHGGGPHCRPMAGSSRACSPLKVKNSLVAAVALEQQGQHQCSSETSAAESSGRLPGHTAPAGVFSAADVLVLAPTCRRKHAGASDTGLAKSCQSAHCRTGSGMRSGCGAEQLR